MGRLSTLYVLVGILFVGGVALAQQGLVTEPWRPVAKPAAPARAKPILPASGLPPASPAASARHRPEAPAEAPALADKWSPPVVELLVDPWAKPSHLAAAPSAPWQPENHEIIDPWQEPAPAPRVARRPAESPRSTIF